VDKTIVRLQPRFRCNTNAAAIGVTTSGRILSYQVADEVNKGRLWIWQKSGCAPCLLCVEVLLHSQF